MVTYSEARSQLLGQQQQVETQRKQVEVYQSQLRTAKEKIPEATSQRALRQTYAGSSGLAKRRVLESARSKLTEQQREISEQDKQLAEAQQQISQAQVELERPIQIQSRGKYYSPADVEVAYSNLNRLLSGKRGGSLTREQAQAQQDIIEKEGLRRALDQATGLRITAKESGFDNVTQFLNVKKQLGVGFSEKEISTITGKPLPPVELPSIISPVLSEESKTEGQPILTSVNVVDSSQKTIPPPNLFSNIKRTLTTAKDSLKNIFSTPYEAKVSTPTEAYGKLPIIIKEFGLDTFSKLSDTTKVGKELVVGITGDLIKPKPIQKVASFFTKELIPSREIETKIFTTDTTIPRKETQSFITSTTTTPSLTIGGALTSPVTIISKVTDPLAEVASAPYRDLSSKLFQIGKQNIAEGKTKTAVISGGLGVALKSAEVASSFFIRSTPYIAGGGLGGRTAQTLIPAVFAVTGANIASEGVRDFKTDPEASTKKVLTGGLIFGLSAASLGYQGYKYGFVDNVKTRVPIFIKKPSVTVEGVVGIQKGGRVFYPKQQVFQQVEKGSLQPYQTRVRELFKMKPIYEGLPVDKIGYANAIKKLVKQGYTPEQAKQYLRFNAPRIIKGETKAFLIPKKKEAFGGFKSTISQPRILVDSKLKIYSRGAKDITTTIPVIRKGIGEGSPSVFLEASATIPTKGIKVLGIGAGRGGGVGVATPFKTPTKEIITKVESVTDKMELFGTVKRTGKTSMRIDRDITPATTYITKVPEKAEVTILKPAKTIKTPLSKTFAKDVKQTVPEIKVIDKSVPVQTTSQQKINLEQFGALTITPKPVSVLKVKTLPPKESLTTIGLIAPLTREKGISLTSQQYKIDTSLKSDSSSKVDDKVKIGFSFKSTQVESPTTKIAQIQVPQQEQITLETITPRFREELINDEGFKPTPIKPEQIIPIPVPSSARKDMFRKIKLQSIFQGFVRRKGKDLSIGLFESKEKAKESLSRVIGGTLAASGFVTEKGQKIKIDLGRDFQVSKRDPLRVVEKRSKRLSTRSEVLEIKRSKRGKKLKWF